MIVEMEYLETFSIICECVWVSTQPYALGHQLVQCVNLLHLNSIVSVEVCQLYKFTLFSVIT